MREFVKCRDGYSCPENWVCRCVECETHPDGPLMADERFSLGIYAGKMCDNAWKRSGFRDEGPESFDPSDAGESY